MTISDTTQKLNATVSDIEARIADLSSQTQALIARRDLATATIATLTAIPAEHQALIDSLDAPAADQAA